MASLAFKVIGTIGLASYAIAYLCTKLRHVDYHRFKVVAVPRKGLPSMPRGYSWRVMAPGEVAALGIDVGPKVQADRFTQGLHCIGVFDRKGELAGVSWLARHEGREDHFGVAFDLPPRCAWDTGLWVPEDKRMGRAFAATWAAIGEWLYREGLDWTLSGIADYNIPSILSHRRLGARHVRTLMVVRIGRLQLTLGAWPMFRLTRKPGAIRLRLQVPDREAATA